MRHFRHAGPLVPDRFAAYGEGLAARVLRRRQIAACCVEDTLPQGRPPPPSPLPALCLSRNTFLSVPLCLPPAAEDTPGRVPPRLDQALAPPRPAPRRPIFPHRLFRIPLRLSLFNPRSVYPPHSLPVPSICSSPCSPPPRLLWKCTRAEPPRVDQPPQLLDQPPPLHLVCFMFMCHRVNVPSLPGVRESARIRFALVGRVGSNARCNFRRLQCLLLVPRGHHELQRTQETSAWVQVLATQHSKTYIPS